MQCVRLRLAVSGGFSEYPESHVAPWYRQPHAYFGTPTTTLAKVAGVNCRPLHAAIALSRMVNRSGPRGVSVFVLVVLKGLTLYKVSKGEDPPPSRMGAPPQTFVRAAKYECPRMSTGRLDGRSSSWDHGPQRWRDHNGPPEGDGGLGAEIRSEQAREDPMDSAGGGGRRYEGDSPVELQEDYG